MTEPPDSDDSLGVPRLDAPAAGPKQDAPDAEGDALAAEIAGDRREAGLRRKRFLLYVPPLASLVIAALAIGAAHARPVLGARVVVGARPPGDLPLGVRVLLFVGRPGQDGVELGADTEVRIAQGMSATTDESGVAELSIPQPLPAEIEVDAKGESGWQRAATFPIEALPAADPTDGVQPLQRTAGHSSGALDVDVAPDRGAIVPPFVGDAWVRVRTKHGDPVPGALVSMRGDAGVTEDASATTDANGFARLKIVPSAPPILLNVDAEKDGEKGNWNGVLGAVMGVPVPTVTRVDPGVGSVTLKSPSPITHVYVDLFRDGVRITGGRVAMTDGEGVFPLPSAVVARGGLYDLSVATSGEPPPPGDVMHAATWPIVVAHDAMDAWSALAPPRVLDRIAPKPGNLDYASAMAVTLARSPIVIPPRAVVGDGMTTALAREASRSKGVRRAATVAIAGGALLELALMVWLGVFRARRDVEEEISTLAGEGELGVMAKRAKKTDIGTKAKLVAFFVGVVGMLALVFAFLLLMAWGLPS